MEFTEYQQEIYDEVVLDLCADQRLYDIAAEMFMDRKRGKLHKLWSSEKFFQKLSSRLRNSEEVYAVTASHYERLWENQKPTPVDPRYTKMLNDAVESARKQLEES